MLTSQRDARELVDSFEKGVWSISERTKGLWNKAWLGDVAVFYATCTEVLGTVSYLTNSTTNPHSDSKGKSAAKPCGPT